MPSRLFRSSFDYNNQVILSRKPYRQHGQDLRDVPTYTIPEAAAFLAVPTATLRYWFTGRRPILKPSGKYGDVVLLSFNDIAEAYILELLRSVHGFKLRTTKAILENAKAHTNLKRPLIEADLKTVLNKLVMDKPARGKLPRRCVDLGSYGGNLVIPELVDLIGRRVMKDKTNSPCRLYPWRLSTADDESRPVTIDPEIMSGRAVITGTRIPISMLAGMVRSGKNSEQIANSYNLKPDVVRKAIQHIERPLLKVA